MKKDKKTGSHEEVNLDRRKALKRLGLAASAVYAAPVLMTLSESAHASEPSSTSGPSAPSVSGPSVSGPSVSGPSASGPSVSGPSVSGPSEPGVISSPSTPDPADSAFSQ